tara:strand:+ start:8204 stop:8392 length:189 start_codon:yes stop_codon:yes gene_type:complete
MCVFLVNKPLTLVHGSWYRTSTLLEYASSSLLKVECFLVDAILAKKILDFKSREIKLRNYFW